MTIFKIGDRIRIIKNLGPVKENDKSIGLTGTIELMNGPNDKFPVLIKLDSCEIYAGGMISVCETEMEHINTKINLKSFIRNKYIVLNTNGTIMIATLFDTVNQAQKAMPANVPGIIAKVIHEYELKYKEEIKAIK